MAEGVVVGYAPEQLAAVLSGEGLQSRSVTGPDPVPDQSGRDPQLAGQGEDAFGGHQHLGLGFDDDQGQIHVPERAPRPGEVLEAGLHVGHDDRAGQFGLESLYEVTDRDV